MLAMRPTLYHRQSSLPTEKPGTSPAPSGIAAQNTLSGAEASPDFDTQIAQARRDARRDPARAAMLLRSWMSDHD
jgi:flagellar biosynthesis/type III secretory pathway M-ring protein FliF/YscJ